MPIVRWGLRRGKPAAYRPLSSSGPGDPGLRLADVFVKLIKVLRENRSFGDGVAQYVT